MTEPLAALRETFAVFAASEETRELEAGAALAFPADAAWRERLEAFGPLFEQAHPAFRAGVEERDGRLWLRVEGPDGAREYVENTLALIAQPGAREQTGWRWKLRRLTAPLRALPDFLIVGAPRSGTTSLYAWLAGHPRVAPPVRKELGFFDREHARGILWYRAHFPLARRGRVTGEATPETLASPEAPARVRAALPGVKLICLLRDPVERAHSHWALEVRHGYETLPFEEALEREDERLADGSQPPELRRLFAYRAGGLYAEQLARWLAVFPRGQLLVLQTEALNADRERTWARVLDFLGLEPWQPEEFRRLHTVPRHAMDSSTRARIAESFREPNRRLAELLGTDEGWSDWLG